MKYEAESEHVTFGVPQQAHDDHVQACGETEKLGLGKQTHGEDLGDHCFIRCEMRTPIKQEESSLPALAWLGLRTGGVLQANQSSMLQVKLSVHDVVLLSRDFALS